MRWVGHVTHMGERRGLYRVLLKRTDGKKPFGGLSHRWEDNIKMGPKNQMGEYGLD